MNDSGVPTEAGNLAEDAGDALEQMNELLDEGDAGAPAPKESDISDLPAVPEDKEEEEEREAATGKGDEEEEEEEEELYDEEEEELREASEPQLIKDIEKKYPKLFKEFKPLRIALLRDGAYSQVFGTPREAAESAQLNEDYHEFESEILAGNGEKILTAIKDTSTDGYKRFVSNFLPSLRQIDEGSYREVTFPIIAEVLTLARQTGEARNDKNLVFSTKHIASLIWPSLKGEIPKAAAPERPDPAMQERERRLVERERQIEQTQTKEFIGGVKSTCQRLLRKKIEKGLDPNNTLSAFLKNSVVEKTMRDVQELLNEDLQFGRVMDRTFGRARKSGYSSEYRTRMVGTFIGRASQLIGPIRKRYLLAALGKRTAGDGRETPPMRRNVGEGVTGGGTRGAVLRASDIDFERSSDYDILSGKVKRRQAKGT